MTQTPPTSEKYTWRNFLRAFRHKDPLPRDMAARSVDAQDFADLEAMARAEQTMHALPELEKAAARKAAIELELQVATEAELRALALEERRHDLADQEADLLRRLAEAKRRLAEIPGRVADCDAALTAVFAGQNQLESPIYNSQYATTLRFLAEAATLTRVLPASIKVIERDLAAVRAELKTIT